MRSIICTDLLMCFAASCLTGCMSQQDLDAKLQLIKDKHGITITADNALSRCLLLRDAAKLLDNIDRSLTRSPAYLKSHIGPVIIEESFADNPEVFAVAAFVRAYVSAEEWSEGYPIHIKNRSMPEKLMIYGHGEDELFLHESIHSFEFNIAATNPDEWERFCGDFSAVQTHNYGAAVPTVVVLSGLPLDIIGVRPASMPSVYGSSNHREDVAETYCYLMRHNGHIEFLKDKDPAFYKKCMIVEKFARGGYNTNLVAKN